MNVRTLLIPLLCIGAVAFACGPRSHSEASSLVTTNIATAATGPTHHVSRKQSRQNVSHVTGKFAVTAQPKSLRFTLDVTNDGKKNAELIFPNGQRYDFTVLDSVGREVYRWADGRMFTQSVQNAMIDGGETMHIAEDATASLPPGSYVAVATLRATNFPVQERAEFELR